MQARTPLTLITGPLGSGKTTLLRHILSTVSYRIAILMNEFGEIAIDSKVLQGKNIEMAELGGGCVCCSLLGEFEAAVKEIIDSVHPDIIVVETTGLAEPDALVFDIQESILSVRLDGVIAVTDADALVKFPQIGHTERIQIESADALLLNKVDLVSEVELAAITTKLKAINDIAQIFPTQRCQIDPDLLFGLTRSQRSAQPPHHLHQPEFDSFGYQSAAIFDRPRFAAFMDHLSADVYRAKGFLRFPDRTYLFNFVAGRWELEPFEPATTELVFIGKQMQQHKAEILAQLQACEVQPAISDP